MGRIVTLFFCICLATLSADDKGKGKGKGKGNQGESGGSNATVVNVSFGTNDVQVIQQYYGAHPVSLPRPYAEIRARD